MARANPRSDLFRVNVSSLVALAVAVPAVPLLQRSVGSLDDPGSGEVLVSAYVIAWPVYVAVYVGWGIRVYSRQSATALARVATREARAERSWWYRGLGVSGATGTTLTAAAVAMVVAVVIARQPVLGSNVVLVGLGLLTVASSWVLMVYSFAQAFSRLRPVAGEAHVRFEFRGSPSFGDYLTLTVLLSTMAATVSARICTREAWRLVRINVLVAFAFNSVIIAMVVSLLFGGLAG